MNLEIKKEDVLELIEDNKKEEIKPLKKKQEVFSRLYSSNRVKNLIEKEKIRNVTHKVDNYLKHLEELENDVIIKAEKEKMASSKKVADAQKLETIVNRLYKVKPVEKKEKVEKDIKKIAEKNKKEKKKEKKKENNLILPILPDNLKDQPVVKNEIMNNVESTIKRGKSANPFAKRQSLKEAEDNKVNALTQNVKNDFKKINEDKRQSKNDDTLSLNFNANQEKKARQIKNSDKNEEEYNEAAKLKEIIKEYGNDLKKLKEMQKKYPKIDLSAQIHKAMMNKAKTKKKTKVGKEEINTSNNNLFKFECEEIVGDNCGVPGLGDIQNENTFLKACLLNNNELIHEILISAKSDEEIKKKSNETDEFKRKGIFYVLMHGNYNMIKLCIISSTELNTCLDKYSRNLFHYISIINSKYSQILEVLIKSLKFELKQKYNELIEFASKAFIGIKEESHPIFEDDIESLYNEMKPKTDIIDDDKEIKEDKKLSFHEIINQKDVEGNTPLHLACLNNNLEVIKILLFYQVDSNILNNDGNRPIDLATSQIIIQTILKHNKNTSMKKAVALNDTNLIDKTTTFKQNIDELIDVKNLKFETEESLIKYRSGYESNNYLILTVLNNNFESFKYLLTEKKFPILLKNSNGWNVLHYIIKLKRFNFLAFMFKLPESDNIQDLQNSVENKKYSPSDLNHDKGTLNYLGESFLSLDIQTNNNINSLFMAIEMNSLQLLKLLVILLKIRETLKELNQNLLKSIFSNNLGLIVNRKYGKSSQTILLKSIEKKNFEITTYIYNEFRTIISLNELDGELKNCLHYCVIYPRSSNFINFFIKIDYDKNELKSQPDKKGKTPKDYDNSNAFENEFLTIWNFSKDNNVEKLEKCLASGFYTINEQTTYYKNTAGHIAAMNNSDKILLYLFLNGADFSIKNCRNLSVNDLIDKSPSKLLKKKFKMIINNEITDYNELENISQQHLNTSNMNSSLRLIQEKRIQQIIEKVEEKMAEKKYSFKKIFDTIDKDKSGKLDGSEFELLFTVLDLDVSKDEILLLMSFADKDKNCLVDLNEFLALFPNHK